MAILALLAGAVVLAAIFGPSLWVRWEMRRHAGDRPDLPGTGGELARHLLDTSGLRTVGLEETQSGGDHYDPISRTVRLSPEHLNGRSVTAVAVAAHEVAHALQHRDGDAFLVMRTRWAAALSLADRTALIVLISIPIFAFLVKSPVLTGLQILAMIALLGARVAVHALTLPLELNASFARALPILERGGYLAPRDMPAARRVLRAAAMTYVAGALATIVDIARLPRLAA